MKFRFAQSVVPSICGLQKIYLCAFAVFAQNRNYLNLKSNILIFLYDS